MKGNRGNGAAAAESPLAAAEELAGFLMAHAVWCVSDGGTLAPLLAYVKGGERILAGFAAEQVKGAVKQALAWMERNPENAERAVFVHDAYVTLEGRRMDALVANVREYARPPMSLQIVLSSRGRRRLRGVSPEVPGLRRHRRLRRPRRGLLPRRQPARARRPHLERKPRPEFVSDSRDDAASVPIALDDDAVEKAALADGRLGHRIAR